MVSTPASTYLCPDFTNPSSSMDNTKTPLQMLAATCNSIGLPDNPGKGKTILPLDCNTPTKSEKSGGNPSSSSKNSSDNHHHHSNKSGKDGGLANGKSSGESSSDRGSSRHKDHHHGDNNSKGPSNRLSPGAAGGGKVYGGGDNNVIGGHSANSRSNSRPSSSDCLRSTSVGCGSLGQALPPTLPPTGTTPKCAGCLPPLTGGYPSMFPLFPPAPSSSTAAAAAIGALPYLHGLPGMSGMNGYSPFHAAAAAASGLSQFQPPPSVCRDPYCKGCPGSGLNGTAALLSAVGNNPAMAALSAASAGGGRCPYGCVQCSVPSHQAELWSCWLAAAASASSYPTFLSAAAAAATGISGLSPPGGLGGTAGGMPPPPGAGGLSVSTGCLPGGMPAGFGGGAGSPRSAAALSSLYTQAAMAAAVAAAAVSSASPTTNSASGGLSFLASLSGLPVSTTQSDSSAGSFNGLAGLMNGGEVNPVSTTAPTGSVGGGYSVCQWGGEKGEKCGRKFQSSEELCEHVRTAHAPPSQDISSASSSAGIGGRSSAALRKTPPSTSSVVSSVSNGLGAGSLLMSSMANGGMPMSLSSAAAALQTNPLLSFATNPLGGGPHSGRFSPRTYLSNLASLSALNRYHPYKPLSGTGTTPNPLAHLSAAFPPGLNPAAASSYHLSAFYGQRLPGSLPHP